MVSELNLLWEFVDFLPAGFIFGFFDNFILLIGAYTGINIEKYIDNKNLIALRYIITGGLLLIFIASSDLSIDVS